MVVSLTAGFNGIANTTGADHSLTSMPSGHKEREKAKPCLYYKSTCQTSEADRDPSDQR